MKRETKTQALYRALSDLHDAAYPHIIKMNVKKGFHELVTLNEAKKVLRKYKVQS